MLVSFLPPIVVVVVLILLLLLLVSLGLVPVDVNNGRDVLEMEARTVKEGTRKGLARLPQTSP